MADLPVSVVCAGLLPGSWLALCVVVCSGWLLRWCLLLLLGGSWGCALVARYLSLSLSLSQEFGNPLTLKPLAQKLRKVAVVRLRSGQRSRRRSWGLRKLSGLLGCFLS